MHLADMVPEIRDTVKSKIAPDHTGIVIAKYVELAGPTILLDVRLDNDRIYYATPATYWEVVKLNDE